MTELQDQLDVLPSTNPSSASATEAQQRAKRRSGSLTSMLLPELQALAGSMGLPAGKQRKSDLINAIQAAQAGAVSARTETRSRAQSSAAAPVETPAAAPAEAPPAEAAPASRPARSRRSASRLAGPVLGTDDSDRSRPADLLVNGSSEPQLSVDTGSSTGSKADPTSNANPADGAAVDGAAVDGAADAPAGRRTRGERNGNRNGARDGQARSNGAVTVPVTTQGPDAQTANGQTPTTQAGNEHRNGEPGRNDFRNGSDSRAENRTSTDARTGGDTRNGEGRNGRGNNNDRSNGDRPSNDRSNNDRSNNDRSNNDRSTNDRSTNDRSNNDRSNNDRSSNDRGEDDDEFGGSRRSRRYRDRRGRTRERIEGGGTSRNDIEPTVSEDDVLVPVAGILDNVDDKSSWFIRVNGYFASNDDIYVANTHVRRYGLRRGDAVTGAVKQVRDGDRKEKFNPLVRLDTVNGLEPERSKGRVSFTNLTPLYPQERLRLETEPQILTTRIIDLVMPIGKGQRALVVSPPKAGKTSVLQAIANAISVNNPECHLMVVLVDERPEEVTDMQRSVKGEVIASTFDRRPQDHTMIAELSIERAKRLVELGHDVVVLLDSITRLGRAYNLAAPASGRILSGGVDSTALYPPKRFLGAARNIEGGGSLTIIATALVETGSTMDTVIFEEFKGTGNAELILDRKIADKRTFPAVDVDRSGTRKEEILMSSEELAVVLKLRRVLHALDPQQGIDLLIDRLKKSRTNIEFLMQISKTAPGNDDRY